MNITFIGNCQTIVLCFYFQLLLRSTNYNICWLLYGDEFKQHIGGGWDDKCKNKILDYHKAIEQIKISDVIIYQEIDPNKSTFCNTIVLQKLVKNTCKLITMPSIYLDYNNYENSIKELEKRENDKNVNIKVSPIFNKYKNNKLMLTIHHPNTLVFLEIVREICKITNIRFFHKKIYFYLLKYNNYAGLPV